MKVWVLVVNDFELPVEVSLHTTKELAQEAVRDFWSGDEQVPGPETFNWDAPLCFECRMVGEHYQWHQVEWTVQGIQFTIEEQEVNEARIERMVGG